MLITNHPIKSRAEDQLDRSNFVRSLTRTALAYKTQESLVIGLKGETGSGKSSLLNLIAEELTIATKYSLDEDKPTVIQFDPDQELLQQLPTDTQFPKTIILIDHIHDLKIIKELADVPNTICILAVAEQQPELDEIVQISFPIPPMTRPMLENILQNNLNQVFSISFYQLFNNIRDVIHYLNMVNFSYGWLETEVNRNDLLIITAIQLFLPEIYQAIRDNKDLFTNLLQASYPDKGAYLQQEKMRLDAIISKVKRISTANLRELLTQLFPKLDTIYKNKPFTITQQTEWRRNNRICDSDTFNNFFLLSLPQNCMPAEEADILLKTISNQEVFVDSIKALVENNQALSMFDFYENYLPTKITNQNIPTAIQALLDCGDLFPPENINIPPHIHQIIQHLLAKLPEQQKVSTLQTALTNTNMSLYLPVYEILQQPSSTPDLQKIIIKKIEQWAHENRLIEHPHLPEILFAWKTWGARGNKTDFIVKLVKTDENLIKFILAFLRSVVNKFRKDITRKPEWQQDLDKIAEFIPLKQIEPRIAKMFKDSSYFKSLREREQVAILIFLDKT